MAEQEKQIAQDTTANIYPSDGGEEDLVRRLIARVIFVALVFAVTLTSPPRYHHFQKRSKYLKLDINHTFHMR